MTDSFLWGGFNLRQFCKEFFRNLWMVIAIMIIAYLSLAVVDKRTYTPYYTSTAVVAAYPMNSTYRYHTIENVSYLSSKTDVIGSVFNSDLFRSEFHNQYPDFQDFAVGCRHIANTELLVIEGGSVNPKNAFEGIRAAIEYYSQFSGDMTGDTEVKIILGPTVPSLNGSSKIRANQTLLCVLSGLMMAGLLLFIYVAKKTYKTERCIRRRYKNIRFFSLPYIGIASENKNGILSKKNHQEPIKKLAIEIKQVLHKCNKRTLLVTSNSDDERGTSVLSELARELNEQNEKVILLGMKEELHDSDSGLPLSDEIRHVLSDSLGYADIILVNSTAGYSSQYAQMWHEIADASIALCWQDDADCFKVDTMLKNLQNSNTYFAGCVLIGF